MGSLVSFSVVIGTVLFCFERCRIVQDWLVFDGVEDLVDEKPEQSEVPCWKAREDSMKELGVSVSYRQVAPNSGSCSCDSFILWL